MAVGKIGSPKRALIRVLLPRLKAPRIDQIKAVLPQFVDELGNIRPLQFRKLAQPNQLVSKASLNCR